jgi:hypothetical protein
LLLPVGRIRRPSQNSVDRARYKVSDLFGISSEAIVLLAIPAILSAAAKGFSGFGAVLIFVPGKRHSRAATRGANLSSDGRHNGGADCPGRLQSIGQARSRHRCTGAALETPVGTVIQVHSHPDALRWATSAVSLTVLLVLLSGRRYDGSPSAPKAVGGRVFGGFAARRFTVQRTGTPALLVGRTASDRSVPRKHTSYSSPYLP